MLKYHRKPGYTKHRTLQDEFAHKDKDGTLMTNLNDLMYEGLIKFPDVRMDSHGGIVYELTHDGIVHLKSLDELWFTRIGLTNGSSVFWVIVPLLIVILVTVFASDLRNLILSIFG